MARAIWKGTIAFGLVSIPVELHTAVRESRPKFRLLHADDRSPLKFERVCTREGKTVAWGEVVKGYEYEKGRFVVLTKEDFQTAALEKTRTIDIRSFVNAADIDDRFFESSYVLMPGKGGEHAYALLREAIRQEERVGIATIILRKQQHLAALEVLEEAMVLTLMRYAEELVDMSEFTFPSAKDLRKPELEIARTLVSKLEDEWRPEQFEDQYGANLMKVIKARMKGKQPKLVDKGEERPADVVDLMERLRKSLEGAPARSTRRPRTAAARKRRSRAA